MTVNAASSGVGKGSGGGGVRKLGASAVAALLAGLLRVLGRAAEEEAGGALDGAGSGEAADAAASLPKPSVEDPKLRNVINDLYRGTSDPDRVGNGTTADAVRGEAESGEPTGGKFHTLEAQQYSRALRRLLRSRGLSPHDRLVAQSLLDDLQNALGNGP